MFFQEVQALKDEFLTTEKDVSALSFLIKIGALTHVRQSILMIVVSLNIILFLFKLQDDFKKYSLLYFGIFNEDEIQTFYNSLVIAFRNVSLVYW